MSHKVTYKSEMKDADLMISALKKTGHTYTREGNSLRITSGALNRASINLSTGDIVSDTDWRQKTNDFNVLRQAYSEEEFTREAIRKGVTIESRTVVDGVIQIRCRAVTA